MPAVDFEKRAELDRRMAGLETARRSFEPRWKTLGDYVLPTRPQFFQAEVNQGGKTKTKVVDTTATQALRIAKSGLLDGMASPQRPWFKLTTQDPGLQDDQGVRGWLDSYRDGILGVFDRSNFYNALGELFEDELVFGTACMLVLADPQDIVRFEVLPIGTYYLGQDSKGRVNTLARKFVLTVRAAVEQFGLDVFDEVVKGKYANQAFEEKVTICHLIEPNPDANPERLGRQYLPWREVYWQGSNADAGGMEKPDWGANTDRGSGYEKGEGILELGGYHEFPVIAARWAKNSDDVYATSCPCIDALGDIKQLQSMVKDYDNAVEKQVDPALQGPPSLDARDVGLLAGAYTEVPDGGEGVRPVHEVRLELDHVRERIMDLQKSVRRSLLEDMILMLTSDARGQPPTAEEVRAREREKAAVLGPIMERHSDDVFDPLIERVSGMLLRLSQADWVRGFDSYIELPPEALEGTELDVQYVSEVAQAQRFVELGSMERLFGMGASMVEIFPDVLDRLDADAALMRAADILGVDASVLRTDDQVAEIRQMRAAAQQEAMEREAALPEAQAAKVLSETQLDQGSALDELRVVA
jgi:hypothetical protein